MLGSISSVQGMSLNRLSSQATAESLASLKHVVESLTLKMDKMSSNLVEAQKEAALRNEELIKMQNEAVLRNEELIKMGKERIQHLNVASNLKDMPNMDGSIWEEIEKFMKRQSLEEVRSVFTKHARKFPGHDQNLLDSKLLDKALNELGVSPKEDYDSICRQFDVDGDNMINLEEFRAMILAPTKLERWTAAIPWQQLAAVVLRAVCQEKSQDDPLRRLSMIDDTDLQRFSIGMQLGSQLLLKRNVEFLCQAFQELDNQEVSHTRQRGRLEDPGEHNKFSAKEMSCGDVPSFYKGLGGRIGAPHLDFIHGMQKEHQSNKKFTTPTYNVKTSPQEEWEAVYSRKLSPEQEKFNRRMPDYEQLSRLDKDKPHNLRANLRDEEIIAIILYTGPMYFVYNMVLRRSPIKEFEDRNGNMYSTTIHCLVSGITKISRVTKVSESLKLYRGFGGMTLPEHFFKVPADGLYKGIVEWGFMSTTSDKNVAIHYTGISKGRSFPTLFQIIPAAIDHGADVSDFSQYPEEKEYLWNPCSLIELQGDPFVEVTPEGIVTIVPVRMNNNVKTMTVEELLEQKKRMHIAGFEIILNEVKEKLVQLAEGSDIHVVDDEGRTTRSNEKKRMIQFFIEGIVSECKSNLDRHSAMLPSDYAKDEVFRTLVMEMLETKSNALSKIKLCIDSLSHMSTGQTALMMVAGQGDKMRVRELITASPEEIRTKSQLSTSSLTTVLHVAAMKGHGDIIQILVEKKAVIDEADDRGRTPLHYAAENGHLQAVCSLINLLACVKQLASIDKTDNNSLSPLQLVEFRLEQCQAVWQLTQEEVAKQCRMVWQLHLTQDEASKRLSSTCTDGDNHSTAFDFMSLVKLLLCQKKNIECHLKTMASFEASSGNKETFVDAFSEIKKAITLYEQNLKYCRDELIQNGSNGWNPLMVAAERGKHHVQTVFVVFTALRAVMLKCSFSEDFLGEAEDSLQIEVQRPKKWTWGSHEKSSMKLSKDGLTVTKSCDEPDYSCAVGSEELYDGIHIWDIQVDNVNLMWLGISKGLESHNGFDAPPGLDDSADYLLAFSNKGTIAFIGNDPFNILQNKPPLVFHSGQCVQFVLDTGTRTLKMKVDNDPNTEIEVTNVEVQAVCPFVCMDESESASLKLRAYCVSTVVQDDASKRSTERAQNNTAWNDQINGELLKFVFEGGNSSTTYESVIECLSKVEMSSNNQAELSMALPQRVSLFKTFKYLLLKICPERNLQSVMKQLLNHLYTDETDDPSAWIKFINLVSPNSKTVFHAAIVNVDALDTLIGFKADFNVLNCKDSQKMSPLHLAAKVGNINSVLRLLKERISSSDVERDESVKSPLELATEYKHSGCAYALKRHGADGWSPLMLAAEGGVSHVLKYLKRRKKIIEVFSCMEKQTDFPEHFETRLKKNQNTRPMQWTWGPFETKSMKISEDKLKVSKFQDVPHYSYALGSEPFARKNDCIYVWDVLIEDVTTMWLGFALGLEERVGLHSAAGGPGDCAFLIAFNNKGESTMHGISQKLDSITPFFSGQKIKFILDMTKNILMMKIDGKKALHIEDIDIPDGVRPYIRCDDKESATLLNRSCISEACSSDSYNAITESEQMIGLDNRQWNEDTDSFLHNNFFSPAPDYSALAKCYPSEKLDELEKQLSDKICTNNPKAIIARLNVLWCRTLMLMNLVNDHNAEVWKAIIMSGEDINMVNTTGSSALHIAAKNGHSGAVNALIKCGYMTLPIDNPDKQGNSALKIAIQNNHFSVIARLVEANADISNIFDDPGRGCIVALKRMGANGWTPLMVAAETGSLYVRHYLHLRDKLRGIFDAEPRSLSVVLPSKADSKFPWTWGKYHTNSMFMDDEMTSVSKIRNNPDYSCALGSEILKDGIHSWDILVYNVENMWVGIAQGVEINGLDSTPSVEYCEYMFVFKNNGRCPPLIFPNKIRPELFYFTDARFRSGQRVNLTLDVKACTLAMTIDGVLAAKVKNLVVQNVRPYVCMDAFETAILENVAYTPANECQSFESTDTNLNDLATSSETVKELLMGNVDEIRLVDLIKADKDINAVNKHGRTALHIAVENCQLDAVSALCSKKHQIPAHLRDAMNKTALHVAAKVENLQPNDPTQANIMFKLLKASDLDGVLNLKDRSTDKIIDMEDENNFTALDIILQNKIEANIAKITYCEYALKMLGSRKWTPLILAAEMMGEEVEAQLRIQEMLQCEKPSPRSSLPEWLKNMIQDYSKLCLVGACFETQLKFDLIHEASLNFNPDKRILTKTDDTSDFSCALGLLNFDYKLHSWEIKVKNVRSIWLGIMTFAKDTAESELDRYLNSSPEKSSSSETAPCTLAFSCDGKCTLEGSVNRIWDTSYCSEQKVKFELDLIGRELTMKVADKVTAIARNLDISRKLYMYVCLGYRDESVTLEKSISYSFDNTDQDNTNDLGMDNCFWENMPKTDQTLSTLAGGVTLKLDSDWENDIPELSFAWASELPLSEHTQKLRHYDDTEVQSIFGTRMVYHYVRGKLLQQRNISDDWIQKILENGYIDCKNYLGKPAIYYAVKNNDVSAVIKLLDAGACVNYGGESLLPKNSVKTRCSEILEEGGADNWTPLMIASQKGLIQVQKYFNRRDKIRNVLLSIQNKTSFPPWFEDKVDKYSNYKKKAWVWGKHVADGSMELSEGRLKAKRVKNTSGYSCAFGSELLSEGIHKWGIVVEDVKSMWLGIATGSSSLDSLPESDGNSGDDSAGCVLMFGNGGSTIMSRQHRTQVEVHNSTKFGSGQTIKFTLNTESETITMKVDSVLAVSVKGVNCKGVFPYVCLGYNESVTVVSRASLSSIKSRDSNQSVLKYKDQKAGLDNSVWNRELKDESLQCFTDSGSVLIFTQGEIDVLQKKLESSNDKCFQSPDLNLKYVAARLNVLGTIDQMLLKMTRVGNMSILKLLIINEEDINATATMQQSALHIAAACGQSNVIRALLERKANINQLDAKNKSPLIVAGQQRTFTDRARISESACEETLKSYCADDWTPLMLAVINGQANVDRYLKWRAVLLCVKQRRPFPNWFADKVFYYSRMVTGSYWSWEKIEERDILRMENGLEVLKRSNASSVSCCIGHVLSREKETHIWAIKVDHVQSMWLGVIEESPHGTKMEDLLVRSPKKMGSGEFIIAIHNDGGVMMPKKDPCYEKPKKDFRYYSGSTLEFKMNYSTGILKITIDGILRYTVPHISCHHLRPYVCMERNESAKITSQVQIGKSEGAPAGIDQQWIDSGLNNSLWSKELDCEINSYFLEEGVTPNFDPVFSKRIQSRYKTWSQDKLQVPKLNAVIVRLNALHVLDKALSSVCVTAAGVEWLKSMVTESEASDIKAKNKQGNSALDLSSKDQEMVELLKSHQASGFTTVSSTE